MVKESLVDRRRYNRLFLLKRLHVALMAALNHIFLRNSSVGLPWTEVWTIEMTFSTLRSMGSLWHKTVEYPDISMLQGNEKRSNRFSEKTLRKCVRVVSRNL